MQFSLQPTPTKFKKKKGRNRRHRKKVGKLQTQGMGCPFSDRVVFRVEMVRENDSDEQEYFSLHWISVRRFVGKEKQKFLHHFREINEPLTYGLEFVFLVTYLDLYYGLQKITPEAINKAFIFEAKKVRDRNIHPAIALRNWREEIIEEGGEDVLATFADTIYHQEELDDGNLISKDSLWTKSKN